MVTMATCVATARSDDPETCAGWGVYLRFAFLRLFINPAPVKKKLVDLNGFKTGLIAVLEIL
jgi:hypothetical protein